MTAAEFLGQPAPHQQQGFKTKKSAVASVKSGGERKTKTSKPGFGRRCMPNCCCGENSSTCASVENSPKTLRRDSYLQAQQQGPIKMKESRSSTGSQFNSLDKKQLVSESFSSPIRTENSNAAQQHVRPSIAQQLEYQQMSLGRSSEMESIPLSSRESSRRSSVSSLGPKLSRNSLVFTFESDIEPHLSQQVDSMKKPQIISKLQPLPSFSGLEQVSSSPVQLKEPRQVEEVGQLLSRQSSRRSSTASTAAPQTSVSSRRSSVDSLNAALERVTSTLAKLKDPYQTDRVGQLFKQPSRRSSVSGDGSVSSRRSSVGSLNAAQSTTTSSPDQLQEPSQMKEVGQSPRRSSVGGRGSAASSVSSRRSSVESLNKEVGQLLSRQSSRRSSVSDGGNKPTLSLSSSSSSSPVECFCQVK